MAHKPLRIAVTGFPGTGKTSLVKALGEKFDLPVIEENMLPIARAERLMALAHMQNRQRDIPALRINLIEQFKQWDTDRTSLYKKAGGFVADRWELDLLDWWLVRFGLDRNNMDALTHRFLHNFKEKAKTFDLVVVTPTRMFSQRPNEQGNRRSSSFTTQILSEAITAGLMHTQVDVPILRLPDKPLSVEQRVDLVQLHIDEARIGG